MNSAAKLAAFAAVVAVIFAGAMVAGAAIGPFTVSDSGSSHGGHSTGGSPAAAPRGLAVAEAGYRFVPEAGPLGDGALTADTQTTFAFRIVDASGVAVTRFDQLHERALHLIVLSRNFVSYLHLHPEMDANGRWTIDLPPLKPGSYRVFADFQPSGSANITLGTDLSIPGEVAFVKLPEPSAITTVDGYSVSIAGSPAVGDEPLTFTVQRDGAIVRPDPYLGAAGHLVAIRTGDLAYLHVHPQTTAEAAVTFIGEFPTPGTYRLFFDFSQGGAVHTAAFTVDVPETSAGATTATTPGTMIHSEGH